MQFNVEVRLNNYEEFIKNSNDYVIRCVGKADNRVVTFEKKGFFTWLRGLIFSNEYKLRNIVTVFNSAINITQDRNVFNLKELESFSNFLSAKIESYNVRHENEDGFERLGLEYFRVYNVFERYLFNLNKKEEQPPASQIPIPTEKEAPPVETTRESAPTSIQPQVQSVVQGSPIQSNTVTQHLAIHAAIREVMRGYLSPRNRPSEADMREFGQLYDVVKEHRIWDSWSVPVRLNLLFRISPEKVTVEDLDFVKSAVFPSNPDLFETMPEIIAQVQRYVLDALKKEPLPGEKLQEPVPETREASALVLPTVKSNSFSEVGLTNAGNSCYADSVMQVLLHSDACLQAIEGNAPQNPPSDDRFRVAAGLLKSTRESHGKKLRKFLDTCLPKLPLIPRPIPDHIASAIRKKYRKGEHEEITDALLNQYRIDTHIDRIIRSEKELLRGEREIVKRWLNAKVQGIRKAVEQGAAGSALPSTVMREFRAATIHAGFASLDEEFAEQDAAEFYRMLLNTMDVVQPLLSVDATTRETGPMLTASLDATPRNAITKWMNEKIVHLDGEGHPPGLLPIEVARFDRTELETRKLGYQVDVPETLVVGVRGRSEKLTYQLKSVVIHSGSTAEWGHYYEYSRKPNGTWYEFNDNIVAERGQFKNIKNNVETNGYLLQYELLGLHSA